MTINKPGYELLTVARSLVISADRSVTDIWSESEEFSLGKIGANIGMAIGRSIEAETEMGLEIPKFRIVPNGKDQSACLKKGPAEAGDSRNMLPFADSTLIVGHPVQS